MSENTTPALNSASSENMPDTMANELPLWKVFFYALGNAAGLLTYNTFNGFVTFFYTDSVGLPPHWVGRGWFAFGFWNAVNDPISGWLSDHTQSKIGRRTFYIRLMAIPVAIAFALVWLPPFDVKTDGATPVFVYFLVIISIYDMLQSIITLNQDALFPEMFQDTKSRARGATIRQFVGFGIGGGIAVAVSPFIYDSALGWRGLGMLWGALAAFFYFLSLIGIEEDPSFGEQTQEGGMSGWQELREVLANRVFGIVIAINFVFRFIVGAIFAVLPFYNQYVLRQPESNAGVLAASLFVPAAMAIIGWQFLFRRWGTRRTMLVSFSLSAIFAVPILFTQDVTATLVVLASLGFMVGGMILGPDLMFAEMIDEDFVRTGLRREGVYRGVLGFIYRFPPAFAGLMIGELLTGAGYDADLSANQQPQAVETVIRSFTAFSPLIAVLVGIFVMMLYPLYGERLATIQTQAAVLRREMHQRRKAKDTADES